MALALLVLLVPVSAACDFEEAGEQVSFDTHDADPDWSPDGRLIAFASNRDGGGLYVIDPGGEEIRRVFPGAVGDPEWSPDGLSIAFVGEDGIYVMRASGGSPRRVLVDGDAFLPAWSPDGRRLAIVKEEADFSSAIYVVGLAGGRVERLLPRHRGPVGDARPGSPGALSETEPTWSPDGHEIAFQAGDGQIVAADVESGTRRVVAESEFGYEPAWSPDGTLIAFQCEGSVCVANANGSGDVRRLATDGGDPSWAPDSSRLVFEHYLYGGGYFSDPQSLSVVDLDGDAEKLTFGEVAGD